METVRHPALFSLHFIFAPPSLPPFVFQPLAHKSLVLKFGYVLIMAMCLATAIPNMSWLHKSINCRGERTLFAPHAVGGAVVANKEMQITLIE